MRADLLARSRPAATLPPGKTLEDVVLGSWPGDESDFRIALRQVVKAPADRTLLGLDGAAPTDRQRLVTQARASYAEAKKPRWRTVLDEEGYDEKTLDALVAALTALDVQTAAARTAADAAKLATKTRNADARALRAWVVRIKTLERRNG